MRATWGFVALLFLVTGIACHDKPKRVMRPPLVQSYDLPPDEPKFANPPDYPKDGPQQVGQTNPSSNPLGMKGGGGGNNSMPISGGNSPSGMGPGR